MIMPPCYRLQRWRTRFSQKGMHCIRPHNIREKGENAMKCPVCKAYEQHADIDLHAEGFSEDIITCGICGTIWSVNHGVTEVVKDSQEQSFLSATSECVEADDYSFAA